MSLALDQANSRPLLLLLCGLPGAGKSTFARALVRASEASLPSAPETPTPTLFFTATRVHHVCFDKLYTARTSRTAASFDRDAWHACRREALQTTEILVRQVINASRKHAASGDASAGAIAPEWRTVICIDDNMHLRSMRKPYLRLAQQHACGFVVAYFDVPRSLALQHNHARPPSQQVTLESFDRIATSLQPPRIHPSQQLHNVIATKDGCSNSSDDGDQLDDGDADDDDDDDDDENHIRHSLVVRLRQLAPDHTVQCDSILDLFDFDASFLVARAWSGSVPEPPIASSACDAAERARQHQLLLDSAVSQADLRLRRCVGALMRLLAEECANDSTRIGECIIGIEVVRALVASSRTAVAQLANACRQRVLTEVRAHSVALDATEQRFVSLVTEAAASL